MTDRAKSEKNARRQQATRRKMMISAQLLSVINTYPSNISYLNMKGDDHHRSGWIFVGLITAIACRHVIGFESPKMALDRREAITKATALITSAVVVPTVSRADTSAEDVGESFRAYGVIPDSSASLSPKLFAIEVRGTML